MRRMSRPSPALVVAMIALIAALAGSAVAQQATTAQTKKVKATKIIVKGSITGKLPKSNAVTTSKVRNNNLTGSDIRESTLGKVPSAASADTAANAANATRAATADRATLADGLSNQVNFTPRRVAATDGADQTASRLAAPKVALGTLGQFSYYAKCFSSGTTIGGAIYVESTVDRALMDADSEELDGGAAATDYLRHGLDRAQPRAEVELRGQQQRGHLREPQQRVPRDGAEPRHLPGRGSSSASSATPWRTTAPTAPATPACSAGSSTSRANAELDDAAARRERPPLRLSWIDETIAGHARRARRADHRRRWRAAPRGRLAAQRRTSAPEAVPRKPTTLAV